MKDNTIALGTRVPKAFYEELVKMFDERGFTNISDYLRDLIRADFERWCKR